LYCIVLITVPIQPLAAIPNKSFVIITYDIQCAAGPIRSSHTGSILSVYRQLPRGKYECSLLFARFWWAIVT